MSCRSSSSARSRKALDRRAPEHEVAEAERVGLAVTDLNTARCRMEFFDIGAVVWTLRKCVWWVPYFSVPAYIDKTART